jgi:hypothetical protein
MKIDINKIITTLLLIIMVVLLFYITFFLNDVSKNGRFQSSGDGSTILDTRTGQTYSITPKIDNIDSSFWKRIPETGPIIK